MKKTLLIFSLLLVNFSLFATEKELGSTTIGRWVKIARIQNANPINGGECSSFSGTINVQTDYGQTGSEQYHAIFSFGSRGVIKPLLEEFGNASNRSVNDSSRIEWRIYTDSSGWHYLWFWQSNYSRHATFDYQNTCGTEYWTAENPPLDYTQIWSSINGDRQFSNSITSNLQIKDPIDGSALSIERGGKIWSFSIQHTGDKLFLNNSSTSNTFFSYSKNGELGIGVTDTKGYKLAVAGNAIAEEVKVALLNNWPDFVFTDSYELPPLLQVENHIKENGHLKDIPSAKDVEKNGIFLGEMDSKLLQKIEELTLYTIQQEKKIKKQTEKIENLESLNKKFLEFQLRLEKLESKK